MSIGRRPSGAIYQDTFYGSPNFVVVVRDPNSSGVVINGRLVPNVSPVDLTGAAFTAWIKQFVDADPPLLQLSTPSNGLAIVTPPSIPVPCALQITLTAAQTIILPLGRVYADFMRTDLPQEPQRYFGVSLPVLSPVTRL